MHVGFDRELWAAIQRYTAELRVSPSKFIRRAVRAEVERIAAAQRFAEEQERRAAEAAGADKKAAFSLPRPQPQLPRLPLERERQIREMYALYERGATLREVGDAYGISPERVRQLFVRLDLPRRRTGGRD